MDVYRPILSEKPPLEVLVIILEQDRAVQHGMGLYPGNAGGIDRDHLKRLVRRINTPWISDHPCWGSIDGSMRF